MLDDPYFGREKLVARQQRIEREPLGGFVNGKFTVLRLAETGDWRVGQYVFSPRVGKVVAVNVGPRAVSVVIEHPHEWLPRQDFNEWRAMRQFDEVAERVHHSSHRNIPG